MRQIFRQFFMIMIGVAVTDTTTAREHHVSIITDYETMHMRFEPQVLIVARGDTVVWENIKAEEHNVVTYPDGFPEGSSGFTSPFLTRQGQTWSHVFTVDGTYEYHCIPHMMMGMRGKVIVNTVTPPAKMHKPSREEITAYRSKLLHYLDANDLNASIDYQRVLKNQKEH